MAMSQSCTIRNKITVFMDIHNDYRHSCDDKKRNNLTIKDLMAKFFMSLIITLTGKVTITCKKRTNFKVNNKSNYTVKLYSWSSEDSFWTGGNKKCNIHEEECRESLM
uniref:Uncharacterized protein n=1 Tax=Tetranychus urticae TaxID=32264 RepID=T1JXH2_TETUR